MGHSPGSVAYFWFPHLSTAIVPESFEVKCAYRDKISGWRGAANDKAFSKEALLVSAAKQRPRYILKAGMDKAGTLRYMCWQMSSKRYFGTHTKVLRVESRHKHDNPSISPRVGYIDVGFVHTLPARLLLDLRP